MKTGKYLFAIQELWINSNVCFAIHYCLYYMNYKKKMFVHNAWIMKIFCLQYMNNENKKCLFAIYELWKS